MRRPWTWWLAWSLWAFTAFSVVLAAVFTAMIGTSDAGDPSTSGPSLAAALVAFQLLATVGALIATRHPRNAIGWLFCASAALCQWANAVGAYSFFAEERALPGVVWPTVVFAPAWGTGILLVGVLGFQLFPDGRPLSPRWRWLVLVGVGLVSVSTASQILTPGPLEGAPNGYLNPVGVPGMGRVLDVTWLGLLVLNLASVVSLVLRFRRSHGVERQQLKLFAGTVSFVIASIVALSLIHESTNVLDPLGEYTNVVWLLLISLVPASVGVAILRYRLYDIDRVISKTLVYGSLTVVLGVSYVGLVLAGQALFSTFARGSNLAIAVSTLAVAAIFLPVRSSVQHFVDRRFYRRRYHAQRTLQAFGSRLREQIELDALSADLLEAVSETMQPASASLWLNDSRNHPKPVTIP
jgi:hypothetical protein